MVEKFQETFALPEEAKRRNGERVWGLLERVRGLERGMWDRDGAREDLGGFKG